MLRPAAIALALTALGCKKPEKIAERDANLIFIGQCAKCHGPDGSGVPAMKAQLGVRDLGDPAWQAAISDNQIRQSIRAGKNNMPAWGPVLDQEQIEALRVKVRSLVRK